MLAMQRATSGPPSSEPLYQRLQTHLRSRIESGAYRPGDAFPSESELTSTHSVSRITVRRAIAELQREGLVFSRQGAGTFVADPARAGAQCLISFTSEAVWRGQVPGSRLISLRRRAGPASAARRLGLPDDARIVAIRRLRTLDGLPAYISDAYIPASVLPDMAAEGLTPSGPDQSLYRLIERHHRVPLEDGEEVASAVIASREVRAIFDLPKDSPVLRKTCLLRDRTGRPIIYEEATWGVPQHSAVIWRRSAAAVNAPGGKVG